MELVVDCLKDKESSISNEAKKLGNQKGTTLKAQLKYLLDHQIAINTAKQRYEELISDVNKDVHERRIEIVTMCNNVLNDKNVSLSMLTAPNVKFGLQLDSVKQFCRKLTIDDCDQPAPPSQIKVDNVTSESAKLYWKISQYGESKPLLEFDIEVALLPETERVPEKDELTAPKEKKKKDKSQKKKKKKKSSDDESESEESSEASESESESESESDSSDNKKKRKKSKKMLKKKKCWKVVVKAA